MARSRQPEAERRDFFLVIDEFQNFATDAFASILAEARKYRLSLTLSHQYIDQLSLPIRKAVFGNVGSLLAFRVGHTDGEALACEFGEEYTPAHLLDLPNYAALARMHKHGQQQASFRCTTSPPLEVKCGRPILLIKRCRERFASRRSLVEMKITRWLSED